MSLFWTSCSSGLKEGDQDGSWSGQWRARLSEKWSCDPCDVAWQSLPGVFPSAGLWQRANAAFPYILSLNFAEMNRIFGRGKPNAPPPNLSDCIGNVSTMWKQVYDRCLEQSKQRWIPSRLGQLTVSRPYEQKQGQGLPYLTGHFVITTDFNSP